jgi:hypothetical protein
MKKKLTCIVIFLTMVILLSACNKQSDQDNSVTPTLEATKSAVSISKVVCPFETLLPAEEKSELMNISGKSPESIDFSVDTDTAVRVYWDQVSKDSFVLSSINKDPKLTDDPARKTIIESFNGSSSGCVDLNLKSGQYSVNIESADSDWVVLIQSIIYKK